MKNLLLVVLAAAVAAFLGNRLLYRLQARTAVVTMIPWWEEVCKGLAVWALPGWPVLGVHLLFGLLELAYSAWRGERFLGMVGLAAHGLVGGVAAWLAGAPGALADAPEPAALAAAVLVAGLLHTLVNLVVLGMVFPTLGLPGLASHFAVDPNRGGGYNEHE